MRRVTAVGERELTGSNDPASVVDLPMMIGGASVESATGERYPVFNPANGLLVGTAPLGGPGDADQAVRSATAAVSKWTATPVHVRADAVARGIDAVAEASGSLAILLTREQGKPLAEATTEILGFVERMRAFLRLAQSASDGVVPILSSLRGAGRGSVSSPVRGVAVSLVAWNFPIGLLAKKIGPTLLGGGALIVKPASTTPLTTLRVVALMNVGLPPGVLSCVTGRGDCVGAALIGDAAVARVYLTGSDETGRRIQETAAGNGERLSLELSGSDPMIVCADADLGKAVQAAVVGRFRNAGQACIAVKRLYVAEGVYDEFTSELCRLVRLREPGDGLVAARAPRVRMGPLHTSAHREQIEEQLDDAVRKGAELLAGGGRPDHSEAHDGYFFNPTVAVNVLPETRLMTEEVFGPVLPVFKTRSLDDAIAQANRSAWDLNAYIWTADKEHARTVRHSITCRQLWVNRLSFGSGYEAN